MADDAMGIEALLRRPALELAGLVRDGDVSARELAEAALRRIEATRHLNAFTLVDAEGALAAAAAIRPGDPRPFAGVPMAIKELTAEAGQPLTMGSHLLGEFRSPVDAHVVRRLKAAGFVVVGRTASPEFGILPVTEPRRFGPTRNPWDTARTPGGSSGGAAAAVAAGVLPVAHGSDGGGSIRIPAACCGLVGLKPSRGRISAGPQLGDSFLSTSGALTRTVADTAAMLDVMAGYEVGDATWAAPPAEPFAVTAARPPKPLRIALTTASPRGQPIDPICAEAPLRAARLLESLGHTVEEATPEWAMETTLRPFTLLWSAMVASALRFGEAVRGRAAWPQEVEPLTWHLAQRGLALNAAEYLGAVATLQGYARRLVHFFEQYDLLLTPSLGRRPLPIGTIDTGGADLDAEFAKAGDFTPFTAVWNTTGQPAISLPLFQGEDGLPVGVQLVGPPLGEGLLLSVATQLEAAHSWADRHPAA